MFNKQLGWKIVRAYGEQFQNELLIGRCGGAFQRVGCLEDDTPLPSPFASQKGSFSQAFARLCPGGDFDEKCVKIGDIRGVPPVGDGDEYVGLGENGFCRVAIYPIGAASGIFEFCREFGQVVA